MTVPNKIYRQIEGFSFMDRAIVLALVTDYLENGEIACDGEGFPYDFFLSIRPELDKIIKRRAYARNYRERKKKQTDNITANDSRSKSNCKKSTPTEKKDGPTERPTHSDESSRASEILSQIRFSRRERRFLKRKGLDVGRFLKPV